MKLANLETILYTTDVETVHLRNTMPERLPLLPKDSWSIQLLMKPGQCKLPRGMR